MKAKDKVKKVQPEEPTPATPAPVPAAKPPPVRNGMGFFVTHNPAVSGIGHGDDSKKGS